MLLPTAIFFFFFNDPAPTEIYTLSLHDALPISVVGVEDLGSAWRLAIAGGGQVDARWVVVATNTYTLRSEEHTSELQSRFDLVCRLLLEKKKKKNQHISMHSISGLLLSSSVYSS